ncbi:MAG TPA: MarR family transcriptional regulator [Syntrophobacteraceae bacterium]|jgi:MarR family transcriptional regulator, organic hydroperoxide resistance regulator|nr:MarR family transcriptional regulator [Syntrophobacteraceae bacterium]HBD07153.1 MarR family transcriptional regulator [Syntrophobacteraceae bacterium]HBZ55058.1 MarR family transcriptional regulator [Syntrophobacteraceae bacterium]
MRIDECIFFLLAKCNQAGSRFWAQKVAALGVTAVQAMVLGFLSEEDLVSSRQLGERTVLDSATITGILDRLEGVGYIERRANPEDRRAIVIGLTAKGREVAGTIQTLVEAANREFLNDLSNEEEAMLRGLLKRLKQR